MTVAQLLASVSSKELTEWQAFFALEEERRKREEKEAGK